MTLRNNIYRKKLPAGALQYVIFIAIVIVLLLSVFIMWTRLQIKFAQKNEIERNLIHLNSQAVAHFNNNPFEYGTSKDFYLDENKNYLTQLTLKHWGVYDIIYTKTSFKQLVSEKIFLTGGKSGKRKALYLEDHKKPLVVVGRTNIVGDAALPRVGVKSGYISGNSYYGKSLVHGNISNSNSSLPKLVNRDYLHQLADGRYYSNTNLNNGNLMNSFYKPTLYYHSTQAIRLSNISLKGNIIIVSKEQITLNNSALLQDVILIAPKIQINNSVKGTFQAFATEKLAVGEGCTINYPSALCLVNNDTTLKKGYIKKENRKDIVIGAKSNIQGIVAYFSKSKNKTYTPQVLIAQEAVVDGELYCEKNLDLNGTVNGSVYTAGFLTKQKGAVYQNHLYNGVINSLYLPLQYAGCQFDKTTKTTAKCLY